MKTPFSHIPGRFRHLVMGIAAAVSLTACATVPASSGLIAKEPVISKTTKTQAALQALSPPKNKVTVAVYEFQDKTGQFKPTDAGQTLSRAVTQGGNEVLIKALQDAGQRQWFTIIERSNLNNLLKERQIITEMRSRYLGETQINSKALPPLLFAGVIFEGGIVGYDTNTLTGGAAARYLGIGGKTDYRQSVVTVHLRAVSVKTGEVLASVNTEKTIASVGIAANAFRFVTFDNLLEADAGVTSNEPGLLALRQAVEKSVYALIMEGSEIGLWEFKDRNMGLALLDKYKAERDGRPYKAPKQTAAVDANPAAAKPVAMRQTPQPVLQKQQTVLSTPKAMPRPVQVKPKPRQIAQAKPYAAKPSPVPQPSVTTRVAAKAEAAGHTKPTVASKPTISVRSASGFSSVVSAQTPPVKRKAAVTPARPVTSHTAPQVHAPITSVAAAPAQATPAFNAVNRAALATDAGHTPAQTTANMGVQPAAAINTQARSGSITTATGFQHAASPQTGSIAINPRTMPDANAMTRAIELTQFLERQLTQEVTTEALS